jgi:hypothetical protein
MKILAFWDVAPCSLMEVDGRFRDALCLRQHCTDDEDSKKVKQSRYTPWRRLGGEEV